MKWFAPSIAPKFSFISDADPYFLRSVVSVALSRSALPHRDPLGRGGSAHGCGPADAVRQDALPRCLVRQTATPRVSLSRLGRADRVAAAPGRRALRSCGVRIGLRIRPGFVGRL